MAVQHSFKNRFGDDTSMYGGKKDLDNLKLLLQNDITNISIWFKKTRSV